MLHSTYLHSFSCEILQRLHSCISLKMARIACDVMTQHTTQHNVNTEDESMHISMMSSITSPIKQTTVHILNSAGMLRHYYLEGVCDTSQISLATFRPAMIAIPDQHDALIATVIRQASSNSNHHQPG